MLTVEVWRDKAIKRISVTVEELKEKTSVANNRRNGGGNSQGETAVVNRIGLEVERGKIRELFRSREGPAYS